MRVLAHIHTFNDADIIDRTIEAVQRQRRPVDGILVVDNGSTDGTLERPSVKQATVVRHDENLGTSGAVCSGFRFALAQDYDWIWLFDADSVPEPDALEKLLGLYGSWPKSQQDETGFLACLYYDVNYSEPHHGGLFTPNGMAAGYPSQEQRYYPCHFTIWSGCLYRLAAVREIGLPNANYVLDGGEGEYAYRVMKAGYKAFIQQDSILHHNIRGHSSIKTVRVGLGPARITFYEFPAIRCYYSCRNLIYFNLYEFSEASRWLVVRALLGATTMMAKFLLRPRNHRKQILACFRGIWHGVTGNITARY
jgi:GT2 family glycosyltransferase